MGISKNGQRDMSLKASLQRGWVKQFFDNGERIGQGFCIPEPNFPTYNTAILSLLNLIGANNTNPTSSKPFDVDEVTLRLFNEYYLRRVIVRDFM
jgi:hypothetical protein